jgi:hypothetical protein
MALGPIGFGLRCGFDYGPRQGDRLDANRSRGLNFEDGCEIILRDAPAEFAQACLRLLGDPSTAARIGRAALRKARGGDCAVIDQLEYIFCAGYADSIPQRVPA